MHFGELSVGLNALIVVISIVIVGKGAHWVVESASRLALHLGISELIIGLTVVSLGTSAPEFAVTLLSAYQGQGNISVGNIVGSNIFNLGFILGGCAMMRPIKTSPKLFWRDGMVLAATTVLISILIGQDLSMDRSDGCILLLILAGYLIKLYKDKDVAGCDELEEAKGHPVPISKDVMMLVVGLIAIVGGSHIMVEAAVAIARAFQVSDWVIGVTIVAAGTSAPEFATTVVAGMKGRHDIGAGNLIGSDIFNLLGVLGCAGVLHPVQVDALARVSLVALCGMVFLALFFVKTGYEVSRKEGAILVLVALARWGYDFASRMGP